MLENIYISGFSDEITQDFDEQLRVIKSLGMNHICFRSAEGKGIANYTLDELTTVILPKLNSNGINISSLGSVIGKISVDDEDGFKTQLSQLEMLCKACKILNCKYIRIFSFFIPEDKNPDNYKDIVINKLVQFVKIAEQYDVVLLHENEKGIFGDTGIRCKQLFDSIASPKFRAAFDFANFVQCDDDPEQCWDYLAPHIEYIHIKDAVSHSNDNVLCGTGEGKIPELLKRALKVDGYKGFLTLEPHLVSFDYFAPSTKGSGNKVEFVGTISQDPAAAFELQFNALQGILKEI